MRIVIILHLSLIMVSSWVHAEPFRVGLRYLPSNLKPRKNQINTNHYILLHLYYPLFDISNGEITSHFLNMKETVALNPNFTSFKFCLKPNVVFSDGSLITTLDLKYALEDSHRVQETLRPLVSAKILNSNCVQVVLKDRDTNYFHRLTGVATTILKRADVNRPFPTGLGPYLIEAATPENVKLRATPGQATKGFDVIEFKKWSELSNEIFDDLNHIYPRPNGADPRYSQRVRTPVYKTYALIINLPEFEDRKKIASCLRGEKFRKAVRPDLVEAVGFLPPGMHGSKLENYVQPSVTSCNLSFSENLDFLVLLKSDEEPARKIVAESFGPSSIYLKVKSLTPESLAHRIFDRKPKIVMLGFDSSGSTHSNLQESSIFFESFIRDQRVISLPPPNLEDIVRRATLEKDPAKKDKLYKRAHRILLGSHSVVPIGYVDNDQRYPPSISNIQWADRLSGFPKIQELVKVSK